MDENTLLELYLRGDPRAVDESLAAHGYICRRLAMNILASEREAEACLRAAFEQAYDSITPYACPPSLGHYLLTLTRSVALERYETSQAVKRGYNLFATIRDELSLCRPSSLAGFSGGFEPEAEAARAGECMTRFLAKQSKETRDIFLCRFFYAESLSEIARRFGLNENRVKSRLRKTCARLGAYLSKDARKDWYPDVETLVRGVGAIDPAMIRSAHGKAKKARRLLPWAVAACVIAALAVSFPYLRNVINTDLVLRGPDWNKEKDELGDAEIAVKPSAESIKGMNIPVTLGGSTLTVIDVTETTVTLTLVKTDDTPLYAAVYDRMGDALACTDPTYKVDGVTIRAGRIKVYAPGEADGGTEPATELPTAPGTYTLVIDFTSIRNGTYPMDEYVGFLAYIGKDGAPVTVYFSLHLPEADTTADESKTPIDPPGES